MAKKSNRQAETPKNEEVTVVPKDENVYPDAPRGADAQSLGLEETRKAREEEEKLRSEGAPKSENGMYGNTKPFSAIEIDQAPYLQTESTEKGDLSLVSRSNRRSK